ncbi:hypothetical protein CRG98_005201 [Punica granatum]|uniref:Ammonium transporter n=1 Tax=Punica granatum TaxID=22663 RepID=A0A2I0L150_PUNGR|nr:hypothetical protein CRG98_005201 [Punica granatum]
MRKADSGWQLTAATMVGLQSVPGLVILYGSMVKKKWAINSAFMALYAFAAVLLCWVLWAHHMSFGTDELTHILGKPGLALSEKALLDQQVSYKIPVADFVYFQFAFAAITVILLAGSLLGRMSFYAWMWFVPLWVTFSYTVGAYTVWSQKGFQKFGINIIDYAGGFVIHLSSGVAGFTAAYWVGPRHSHDRQNSPPNNIIQVLGGAGFLWMGWTGFNGGAPFSAGLTTSLAILNTHLCTATSLFVWLAMDMIFYEKSSVIGAVQGMITGLVCITPAAGVVESWAAMLMGTMSGSIPWYTMMVLHRRYAFFQKVDDTLAVFHTHAVAGTLGGLMSGILAKPHLLDILYGEGTYNPGLLYSLLQGRPSEGFTQLRNQLIGVAFITAWNVLFTSLICILISRIVNLRMAEEELEIGDNAVHGEEAYALWGDGERLQVRLQMPPRFPSICRCLV